MRNPVMQKYSAVVAVEGNLAVRGDVKVALQCASQGNLLATAAATAPLSGAFLTVAPSKELQRAATHFLANTALRNESSWAGSRAGGKFKSTQCGAGLLWAMFFESEYAADAQQAFVAAGVKSPPTPFQLDRCLWARHTKADPGCKPGCDGVRLAHPMACGAS